jgi:hypothetical protein
MSKKLLFAILILALSVPAIWNVITAGYFPVHDNTQVVRVQQMQRALLSGQLPVRWVPDLGYGYGYPLFNFYNPFPYYVAAGGMMAGVDVLLATKLMMALPVMVSGVTMYLLARTSLSRLGSLLAGVLYVYAPYHGVQIYVRGAVAESWAYAWLPFVFWAVIKRRSILGGLTVAVLVLSHNLTAFMTIPFIAILISLQLSTTKKVQKKSLATDYLLLITLGLGLSAFFWLPAITESHLTGVSEMVFQRFDPPAKHLITPGQLWASPWGYGGSSPGTDDGLSLQLGKIHLLGSLVAMASGLYGYKALRKNHLNHSAILTIFSILGLLLSLFLILPPSAFIWNSTSLFSYIQFPWRFLAFASLFSSLLAAGAITYAIKFLVTKLRIRPKKIQFVQLHLLIVFCFFLVVHSLKFFRPQFKFPTTSAELTSYERIVWEVSQRSDEYLPKGFVRPKTLKEALRVDNVQNRMLVDRLKEHTPTRGVANAISGLSIIGLASYYVYLSRLNNSSIRKS